MKGISKRNGIILGVLFLLPFFLFGIGSSLLDPIFQLNISQEAFLQNAFNFKLGGLLVLGNSIVVLALSSLLFSTLWKYNQQVAIGYLLTRAAESILLLGGLMAVLSFAFVVQHPAGVDSIPAEAIKWFAKSGNHLSFQIAMLILGLGSLPVFLLFYIEKTIPRALSIWACVGYALLFSGAVAELLGYPYGVMLAIPGGLFELSFGGWLIIKSLGSGKKINHEKTSIV